MNSNCTKYKKCYLYRHRIAKDTAISRSSVFEWYKLFQEGRELDENMTSHRSSICLISERLSFSYDTVQVIIAENVAIGKVCAKFVPRILIYEPKANLQ